MYKQTFGFRQGTGNIGQDETCTRNEYAMFTAMQIRSFAQ